MTCNPQSAEATIWTVYEEGSSFVCDPCTQKHCCLMALQTVLMQTCSACATGCPMPVTNCTSLHKSLSTICNGNTFHLQSMTGSPISMFVEVSCHPLITSVCSAFGFHTNSTEPQYFFNLVTGLAEQTSLDGAVCTFGNADDDGYAGSFFVSPFSLDGVT